MRSCLHFGPPKKQSPMTFYPLSSINRWRNKDLDETQIHSVQKFIHLHTLTILSAGNKTFEIAALSSNPKLFIYFWRMDDNLEGLDESQILISM